MTTAAAAAGSAFVPKGLMVATTQDPVVDKAQKNGKPVSYEKISWQALPFPMKQVR